MCARTAFAESVPLQKIGYSYSDISRVFYGKVNISCYCYFIVFVAVVAVVAAVAVVAVVIIAC